MNNETELQEAEILYYITETEDTLRVLRERVLELEMHLYNMRAFIFEPATRRSI
jgi:hypothetical protein